MKERIIDRNIKLIPYYRNDEVSLPWYQDLDICKQVDNRDNSEIAIVICKEYQNKHIGRLCVLDMIKLAKEKGMEKVKANIYSFNKQSQRMFSSIGFNKIDDE